MCVAVARWDHASPHSGPSPQKFTASVFVCFNLKSYPPPPLASLNEGKDTCYFVDQDEDGDGDGDDDDDDDDGDDDVETVKSMAQARTDKH